MTLQLEGVLAMVVVAAVMLWVSRDCLPGCQHTRHQGVQTLDLIDFVTDSVMWTCPCCYDEGVHSKTANCRRVHCDGAV